jgi:aspartate carbamoyltransferase regulatory subunit
MSEMLSVSAIKNGTVIDHITSGQALRILHLLSLNGSQHTITVGLNLPSQVIGTKDLIKIENRILTEDEANEIVVFAPSATINVIENFHVVNKINTRLPKTMKKVFICPNPQCITQTELINSHFAIKEQGKQIKLTCFYCDKEFDRDQIQVGI